MGAFYVIEADLKVQLDKVAALGKALQSELYSSTHPGPDTVEDVLDKEFRDPNLEYKQEGDFLRITGTASGDFSYSMFNTLVCELEPFVEGVLDICEDGGDWTRIRYRNGKMVEHAGEVVFPTDTDEEDERC
jgi:hypothetical protein